ncbi:hypothetical protein HMPREF1982_01628 [Clostridiales bacterium oral taxon 876 str. F0540]|nr:hypothetical protein HMPREF1982_01628 [Clostridiales bacterium oral taxon 876 str. F0540]
MHQNKIAGIPQFYFIIAYLSIKLISMGAIVSLVRTIGFSIALYIYSLIRIEGRAESIAISINTL